MNNPAAYTPLESLFLFQSLLTHGLDAEAFTRISESLRNNALVKGDGSFDAARLAPDALQHLFLVVLRDEVKAETERAEEAAAADGSSSPASRKRKMGSPPLPSLREAREHIGKLPVLLDRLYARYRDSVVKQIREDERRLALIQRDITVLEKSERERLAKAAAIQNGPPAPRDERPVPGQLPAPGLQQAAAQAGGGKRPIPTTTTPVHPPKALSKPATQSAVVPPSLLPSGTSPARPNPSPKPGIAANSGLQAPPGMAQTGARPLQTTSPSLQPPAIPSRLEAVAIASKPKEATPVPVPVPVPAPPLPPGAGKAAGGGGGGGLKWERPYQPRTTQTPGTPGQTQPLAPAAAAAGASGASRLGQPQFSPQQLPQGQPASQTPLGTTSTPPVRSTSGKTVLAAPQTAAQQASPLQRAPPRSTGTAELESRQQQQQPPRLLSTTPVVPPVRAIQPQQRPLHVQTSRPIAVAQPTLPKGAVGPVPAPQKWKPSHAAEQAAPSRPSAAGSPAASSAQEAKPHAPSYNTQVPKPPVPEHIIRQAAAAANASTPNSKRISPVTAASSSTPSGTMSIALTRGFGTKWASHSTPSTPRPITAEPESPAYEPVSPPPRAASIVSDTPGPATRKDAKNVVARTDTALPRVRARAARATHRGRGASTTPSSVTGTRRSMSSASQADELSMDHHPAATTKIKHEVLTPRQMEETGDTTADESVHGRATMATPASVPPRLAKRKRQDSPPAVVPPPLGPPTRVLWTRGFTKVSSSALDQISSHRDANMFATGVRERDAPNYRQIVLQPQDITSIRSAIKQGNKAALQAASNLPGGDPGTAIVWLPMSDDLVPPRGIINSAQLERELVHMFCNAIMYNPDPDRGPGPSFLRRNKDAAEEEIVGYHLDEHGVVKNTRSMFVEVEKLLGNLRSAEKERGVPPAAAAAAAAAVGTCSSAAAARQMSVATAGDDTAEDEDELAGNGEGGTAASVVKRRRVVGSRN